MGRLPRRVVALIGSTVVLVVALASVMIAAGHVIFGIVWMAVAVAAAAGQLVMYDRAARRAAERAVAERDGEPAP